MANWCSNSVQLVGTKKTINQIQQLFNKMAAKQIKDRHGQLPDLISEKRGYFFDIRVEGDVIYYETRWSPNTDIIVQIANHFKIEFVHSYEESGCQIFGEAEYRNGILKSWDLETGDFDLYEENDENDGWIFENEFYESDYEIKEILLERKKENR